MSLSTSSLSGLEIGFVHITPPPFLSPSSSSTSSLLFSMIVLFSVVQRVAWYERSRPDCFFSIVFNLGVFFSVLCSFPFLVFFFLGSGTARNALLLNHSYLSVYE
ncbi:hypothetical protein ACN38_g4038 [Penicillium nordicum]|uniref:Uncharacterized protein n=1 Tax=Penicillium nordicum TaxID=229535 RepID=A0A0M9WHF7_9EURO|nr:hypothetical protein ACN38_g4038 [Penicillium nordicum]